jgi:hypothetical protein
MTAAAIGHLSLTTSVLFKPGNPWDDDERNEFRTWSFVAPSAVPAAASAPSPRQQHLAGQDGRTLAFKPDTVHLNRVQFEIHSPGPWLIGSAAYMNIFLRKILKTCATC